ncbi:hypothetical protein NE237_033034 [Protea cynaroides]|uniref:Uncharacterized protein n=1 Tax=Protea cynaroides TaxID=273540 RepID=A0A9Q0R432_9MAGN|nr:hypothetical protein NE237_033034 [Protea cynaroides]
MEECDGLPVGFRQVLQSEARRIESNSVVLDETVRGLPIDGSDKSASSSTRVAMPSRFGDCSDNLTGLGTPVSIGVKVMVAAEAAATYDGGNVQAILQDRDFGTTFRFESQEATRPSGSSDIQIPRVSVSSLPARVSSFLFMRKEPSSVVAGLQTSLARRLVQQSVRVTNRSLALPKKIIIPATEASISGVYSVGADWSLPSIFSAFF